MTFVDQAAPRKLLDRGRVSGLVIGLVVGRLVPGHTDGFEITKLAGSDLGERAVIEVFDSDQEAPTRGPGEQPRQHRGAEVADV
jgi:hypothetical protein